MRGHPLQKQRFFNRREGTLVYPAGPELLMPSVPSPVTKPMLSRLGAPLSGADMEGIRVKFQRNSLTAVGPRMRVLLMVACWRIPVVVVAKPGKLPPPLGSR